MKCPETQSRRDTADARVFRAYYVAGNNNDRTASYGGGRVPQFVVRETRLARLQAKKETPSSLFYLFIRRSSRESIETTYVRTFVVGCILCDERRDECQKKVVVLPPRRRA